LCNGHLFGSFNAIRIIHFLYNYGIKECTLYVLSYDNFIKRSSSEKDIIFTIIYTYLLELINYIITCSDVYVQFIGELDVLPENIRIRMLDIQKICESKNINDCYIINYAIAYDGRREIYYCMKNIFQKNSYNEIENNSIENGNIDNILFNSNSMWLKRDIDIVIRSGETKRMSSFFPWQTIYSEWYFLNKYWPEVNEEDIYEIINDYKDKTLNFGA
jgi:undecaprenyl diphosphate synthase